VPCAVAEGVTNDGIQASFANAAEFFNSLLERILHPLQGGMASVLDLDPAWGAASRHLG